MFAVEFFLSLCESAPDMLRKSMAEIEAMLRTAAVFVCQTPDDPDWAIKEDDIGTIQIADSELVDDLSAMTAVGDEVFDRLATAIGGRALVMGSSCFSSVCAA
jgi:hypothetical protein